MLMAHAITTSVFLLLLLLLCSTSLSGATSTEHNVMTASIESSADKQDNAIINKELEKLEMTKYQKGRKMGGFEVKKDSTETGKVTETETKPAGSSTKDAKEKDTGSKTELSKIPAQPGANQNLEPHNNGDVVMEIFNMLKRDYSQKARRRGPINNALPLDDEEP